MSNFNLIKKIVSWVAACLLLSANLHAENGNLTMEQRLQKIERLLKNQTQFQVEQQRTIKTLQTENQELRGTLEELNYQLKQLTERQREIYRDLDERMSQVSQVGINTSIPANSGVSANQLNLEQASTKQSVQALDDNSVEANAMDERKAYETIFPLVREKKYLEALQRYQEFLTTFPNGQLAPNAYYWMGQVHYVQGQFSEAERAFDIVINQFPKSPRVGDSKIKKGRILMRNNQWEAASVLFEEVIKEYGGSTQQLAKESLRKIKQRNTQ
ncbi:MAG: tol-pal system protein YbgF [Pseudomonadota bacterium]